MSGYDVRGPVQKIEQRTPCTSGLEHLRSFDTFDIEFSPKGRPIQLTHYTGAGTIDEFERFVYDDAGNLIVNLWFDGAGSQIRSTESHYDAEGKCIGWTTHTASGAMERRCVQSYVDGLLVSSATSSSEGVSIVESEFEYKGRTLWRSNSRFFGIDGNLSERSVSYYDADGRVVETFGLTPDGTPLGDGRYKFEYDAEGRELKTWSFNDLADDDVPNALTVCEYTQDHLGNWTERCRYHRFKNDSRWTMRVSKRKVTYYPEPVTQHQHG